MSRREHYGVFYGLHELPASGRQRAAVFGNCQAEALRVCLDTSGAVDTVRMPPAHELEADDVPHLHRVLRWTEVLLAQEITDDYRGLPLGTRQVAGQLAPGARVVPVPNYFHTGPYPQQVLVRDEDPGVVDPPVVPYHDVRRLGRAAGWRGPDRMPEQAIRDGARDSLAELRRREAAQGSVVVSDVVEQLGARAGWTVDHPGNGPLLAVAGRALDSCGIDGAVHDPGRTLLSAVRSPLAPEVVQALRLADEPRADWLVDGRPVSDEEIGQEHERFYRDHPAVVRVGVRKRGAVLARLGWSPG